MRILLVGNYITDAGSMQKFGDMLYDELNKRGHDVRLITPKNFFRSIKASRKGLGRWIGYINKFIIFPMQLKKESSWSDVVHIVDHSRSMYLICINKKPAIITCHDLLAVRSALNEFKENPIRWTGKILQKTIIRCLSSSQHIACVSKKTKEDILRITKVKPKNVEVAYQGLNYPYTPMKKDEAMNRLKSLNLKIKLPFFLHVGSNDWYKNRLGVLKIFACLIKQQKMAKMNLVMVGEAFTKEMNDFIEKNKLIKKVIKLTKVPNEDLCALYSVATALIYPSLQEGCGLPIMEAQACGCPVFTSNRDPMREVGGDAAIYFDPENHQHTAKIITKNITKVKKLRKAGFKNVKRFPTENMINAYVKIYNKLAKHRNKNAKTSISECNHSHP